MGHLMRCFIREAGNHLSRGGKTIEQLVRFRITSGNCFRVFLPKALVWLINVILMRITIKRGSDEVCGCLFTPGCSNTWRGPYGRWHKAASCTLISAVLETLLWQWITGLTDWYRIKPMTNAFRLRQNGRYDSQVSGFRDKLSSLWPSLSLCLGKSCTRNWHRMRALKRVLSYLHSFLKSPITVRLQSCTACRMFLMTDPSLLLIGLLGKVVIQITDLLHSDSFDGAVIIKINVFEGNYLLYTCRNSVYPGPVSVVYLYL